MNKMKEDNKMFLSNLLAETTASMHAVKCYEIEERKTHVAFISTPHIF